MLTCTDVTVEDGGNITRPFFTPSSSPAYDRVHLSPATASATLAVAQSFVNELPRTPIKSKASDELTPHFTPSTYAPPSDVDNPWEGDAPAFTF